MTARRILITAGVVGGVVLVGALVATVAALARSSAAPQPPALAGQAAPAKAIAIDFDKRYDLHCALGGGALGGGDKMTVFRKCKVIGFTAEGEAASGGSFSGGPFSSSRGYGRSTGSYFSAWLVLELPDGRRAYLPPSSVKYMEEAEGN